MKNFTGIDIGSYLTKVIGADFSKGILEISILECFETPYKQEGEVDEGMFFKRLSKIISLSKLKTSNLSVSVPSSAVNFSVFDLPKMPKSDLDIAAIREARGKIVPTPSQGDVLKYVVLKETKLEKAVQLNILASAEKKDIIFKYFSLFKNQGIIPNYIGSIPLSLMLYYSEQILPASENWALIDIGFKSTTIAIFTKGKLSLIRNIPFACSDFIQAISRGLGLDFKNASETFLREEAGGEVLAESWRYLLSEIRRSFAYYKEVTRGEKIDSILFSGGMSRISSAVNFLRRNVGGKINIFDLGNLKRVSVQKSLPEISSRSPLFFNALALILSQKTRYPTLNLLPAEVLQEKKARRIRLFSTEVLILSTAVLIFIFFSLSIRTYFFRKSVLNLQKRFPQERYQSFVVKARGIKSRLQKAREQSALIDRIKRLDIARREIFTLIGQSIPPEAFLKEMEIKFEEEKVFAGDEWRQDGFLEEGPPAGDSPMVIGEGGAGEKRVYKLELDGIIVGSFEEVKKPLEAFCRNLEATGIFSEVELKPLKLEEIVIKSKLPGERLTEVKEREFTIGAKIEIE